MALITKISPKGVDSIIDRIQRDIYGKLSTTIPNYQSYSRCYVIERDGMLLPTLFNGIDYTDVLYNDKYDLTSFFHAIDDAVYSDGYTIQTVDIIFQGNLKKIFPTIPHRADEEFKSMIDGIYLTSSERKYVRKEVNNVYSEFKFNGLIKEKILIHNMNDLFVMKCRVAVSFINVC